MSRGQMPPALAGLLAAVLLSGLSVAAPVVNAAGHPPRTVFLELPADRPLPTVSLSASTAPAGGLRLEIETTGFHFTEVCLSQADAVPVGHAHILVDGAKVASAYGPLVDIAALPPGRHVIEVVLRGQDHRALTGPDGLIKAGLRIDV